MKYAIFRKKCFNDVIKKYKVNHKIDLKSWKTNPYIKIKYLYINEISAFVGLIFYKLNISPNTITLANIFFAIVATIIFVFNFESFYILGLLIFFSKNIFDNIDGFIARITNKTSRFGHKLDFFSGIIYYYGVLISLTFHSFFQSKDLNLIYALVLITLSDLFNINKTKNKQFIKNQIKKKFIYKIYNFFNYDGRTTKTDFILLIILLEKKLNVFNFSYYLIILFLIIKLSRNLYSIIK